MVLFRNLEDNHPPGYVSFAHWQAEYYPDWPEVDAGHPWGLAWVTEFPPPAAPVLMFVLVADAYRRRGIGTRLVLACRQRWPGLVLADAPNRETEKFLYHVQKPWALGP